MLHRVLASVVIATSMLAPNTSVSAAEAFGYFVCPLTSKAGQKTEVMTKPRLYAYEPPAAPKDASPAALVDNYFAEQGVFEKAVDQQLDRFLERISEVYGVPCAYKKGEGFVFVHGPFRNQAELQQDLDMRSMMFNIMDEQAGEERKIEYISIE